MTIITIHDAGHGMCISLIHSSGKAMLWDCGQTTQWAPSISLPALGLTSVDYFFVTNYDEDHISDLPRLVKNMRIHSLVRNTSISPGELRTLKSKSGWITPAMETLLGLMGTPAYHTPLPTEPVSGVRVATFCNAYKTQFSDTNNISLVTFVECGSIKLIIPGDLERSGWEALLGSQEFINELSGVNIFVASHHGRENGYHEGVFRYCRPNAFVFSDSSISYASQEMSTVYGSHATGTSYNGSIRHVLSTRKDGEIRWLV